jgi:hypothetical protein
VLVRHCGQVPALPGGGHGARGGRVQMIFGRRPVPGAPARGCPRARPVGAVWLSGLALLIVFGVAMWLMTGTASACDPVTGQGCDMTPSSAPQSSAPQSPAPQAPSAPQPSPQPSPRPTEPPGGPFIPPGAAVTTTTEAPTTTTVAPTTTTEAPTTTTVATTASEPASTSSGSSGGGGPLGRLGPWLGGAALLGGVGIGGLALAGRKKADPLAEYRRTCDELCWLKAQEAQAESDVQAAQAQLAQIDQAYWKAYTYLDNQLRRDYLSLREIHWGAEYVLLSLPILATTPFGLGPLALGNAAAFGGSRWTEGGNRDYWNAQVNAEMKSARGHINDIYTKNRDPWQAKLEDAQQRQTDTFDNRHNADFRLSTLRAENPRVEFPACGCAG